ncbi:cytochrome P450 [Marasmius fiardii PR-910]|nr:cytochrome P450 [Marasmius fiardii PR-910]
MLVHIPFWPFAAIALVITGIFVLDSRRRKRNKTPYPPGSKPHFFVGNLFDLPESKPWEVYRDMGRIYGDIIHLDVLGQHIVVVNSRDLADRMLEKRPKIYSDRPFVPMLDLMGWTQVNTALLCYGSDWRMHRRVYKQAFRATVVPDYLPIVSPNVSHLMSKLRQNPDSFVDHIKDYTTANILATVYGYDMSSPDNGLVKVVEEAVRTASDGVNPAAAVVNTLPALRHLPLGLPVFTFQRVARRARPLVQEMRTVPYNFVKSNMGMGKEKFSLLAKFLEKHAAAGEDEHQEDLIRDALTTAYSGALESTVSVLASFFLAMSLHPEIQKRAQQELDTVIGKSRSPTFMDRTDLPYVEAVLRETLRWAPVAPLGFPHVAFLDDTIDGYFIPKGTVIFANIWAMTHDGSVFTKPESFVPERFLTEDGRCSEDEKFFVFGFGRRICPGRHYAILTLWTAIASILAQFEIGPSEDGAGRPIKSLADVNYSSGVISQPDNFRCVIKPRM